MKLGLTGDDIEFSIVPIVADQKLSLTKGSGVKLKKNKEFRHIFENKLTLNCLKPTCCIYFRMKPHDLTQSQIDLISLPHPRLQ